MSQMRIFQFLKSGGYRAVCEKYVIHNTVNEM